MLSTRLISRSPAPGASTAHSPFLRPQHSPSYTRSFSAIHPSLKSPKPPTSTPPPTEPTIPFNIFYLIREANRPVRYTVFGALGLLATVECTFWVKVIQHKFFSPDDEASGAFFAEVGERVARYRAVWLRSYGGYYGESVWGL